MLPLAFSIAPLGGQVLKEKEWVLRADFNRQRRILRTRRRKAKEHAYHEEAAGKKAAEASGFEVHD
jgi:hypothetical protein